MPIMDVQALLVELRKIRPETKKNAIHLEIHMKCPVKERPRRTAKGGKVWWYTPSSDKEAEIGIEAAIIMRKNKWSKLAGRIRLSAVIHHKGNIKADISNYIKAIEDGIEGVCYYNDIQVRHYGKIDFWEMSKQNLIVVDLEDAGEIDRKVAKEK